MSLNPDIRDQAYQFFIEEAQELLQVLETGLLDLRQDRSTSKVHELMRAAHSIKGGAASVELSTIGLIAHRLEDFFKALYSDDVDFDAELEGLLLQGYDCLSHPLTEQIEAGSFDEEAALLKAEPVFAALDVRLEEALKNADNYIPSSNDLGVDIVSSIFEVDVVQALEHLQIVANEPQNYDPAAELESTLEMFAGFAELFNLSGFIEIVETAQAALATNSGNALAILKATLADCTQAKDAVLAGDREQGGNVSPALRELARGDMSAGIDTISEAESIWSTAVDNSTLDIFGAIISESGAEESYDTSVNNIGVFGMEAEPAPASENVDFAEDLLAFDEPLEPNIWSEIVERKSSTEEIGAIVDKSNNSADRSEPVDEMAQLFDTAAELIETEPPEEISAVDRSSEQDIWSEVNVDETSISDIFGKISEPAAEPNYSDFATRSEIELDLTDNSISSESSVPDNLWSDADDSFASEILGNVSNEPAEIDSAIESSTEEREADEDLIIFDEPIAPDDIWSSIPSDALTPKISDNLSEEPAIDSSVENSEPKDLTAAIDSIANIFETLPNAAANKLTTTPIPAAPKPKPKLAPKTTSKKPTPKLSVRVDLERLERMNNLVGELTINRNSLALQNEQLQDNVSELEAKFLRFRRITRQLQEVADAMLLDPRARHPVHRFSQRQSNFTGNAIAEFDSLEMDTYSQLYSSLQVILEEIVQLEESVEDITIFARQSDRTIGTQRQMLGQIRDELMWVRMLPLEQILQRFPRVIRDLSSRYNKPVNLTMTGTGVLVDRAVLEKLSDPLLHLLRNGFDHGIEDPEVRIQNGKSTTGSIEIKAYYQGNQTVIEVKDDGKGLDLARIKQKGVEQGLISAHEAATASKERIFELIFEPGFSTASQVSEISGRGVGMNIVRSQVETLKGRISVTSTPGEGSTFTLRLPLTLTIAKLLVCSLGSTTFAIPADSIEEIIIPEREQIKLANGQKFFILSDRLIPVYSLQSVLTYNCPIPDPDASGRAFKTIAPPEDWAAPLLLLRRGQKLYALEVVSLLSEQELVIKPYGKAIAPPVYSYGCTILSDGSLIPAFDGSALIGAILGEEQHLAFNTYPIDSNENGATDENDSSQTALKTIMIVDDSTALRRTMALTLEKEGYRVVQKKDGKEALNGFKQHPELDLIICDIEMPVMNGFEFLGMRRRDTALAEVPTFMLTSRSGNKHRKLAQQLGADGYFTKPYVEQDFIKEVKRILAGDRNEPIDSTVAVKTKTILVIDDSSALRRTLALSLEQRGYRVLQGRDGGEGLEQLRSNPQTDLVICDVEMPNVNGFEFLTARRQEPALTQVPVVMLTSRGSDKHRNLAASLGADGFFTKPYIEDKFIAEIEQYIRS